MKKNKKYYMSLNYPVQIEEVEEGYCASIPELKGCKAFGVNAETALKELESIKESFFEIFLKMGKPIPEPVVRLDITYGIFRKMKHREDLEVFVVS